MWGCLRSHRGRSSCSLQQQLEFLLRVHEVSIYRAGAAKAPTDRILKGLAQARGTPTETG